MGILIMTSRTTNRRSVIRRAGLLRFFGVCLLSLTAAVGCGPNQQIMNSAEATPSPVNSAPAAATFESDLQTMRDADFKFILVFRRKDGAVLTAEDKSFANANTPFDANRRRLADDGKAIIVGTNFPFLSEMIAKMTDRFTMENYSKPDSGPIAVNANSVQNK